MIPDKQLSDEYVPGEMLSPDDAPRRPLHDYELGGVALQDPSQGLQVQYWHCYYDEPLQAVYIEAPNLELPVLLFEQNDIVELSFCFDQNMRWSCVYKTIDGSAYFRWYDSQTADYVVTTLAAGTITPFLSLDDKRIFANATSDIILTYLRKHATEPQFNTLYFRAQRDRFTIEYKLADKVKGSISNFGMANKLRMEWQIYDLDSVADGFN